MWHWGHELWAVCWLAVPRSRCPWDAIWRHVDVLAYVARLWVVAAYLQPPAAARVRTRLARFLSSSGLDGPRTTA
eukprot:1979084-Alexandrium_andersonii.AAC.1